MSSFLRDGSLQADASPTGSLSESWSRSGEYQGSLVESNQSLREPNENAIDLRLALLARAIEHEIIPRLMLAHRETHECLAPLVSQTQKLTESDVEDFAKLILSLNENLAQESIDAMLLRGISVEAIYLDLLAPVARHLGELWEQDLCDFTEVTIGLGRLHKMLRELSPAFGSSKTSLGSGQRILLMPGPGEQHTFGLVMVSEFFLRAGWDVTGGIWEPDADSVAMVRREWFDVVGFSLGGEIQLDNLRVLIEAVRKSSLNTHLVVMVGGPIFNLHPEFVAYLGADCVATDGKQAPSIAAELVKSKKLERT